MLLLLLMSFTPVILGRTRQGGPRVVELEGEPGFKSVSLAWNMEDTTNWDRRVKLSFCENQVSDLNGLRGRCIFEHIFMK